MELVYRKRKVLAVILTCVMLIGGLVIPSNKMTSEAAAKLKVTAPKTVAVNQSIAIKTNVSAKFKSSNKKIATVSSKGIVKGKKAGTVKITVTSKKDKKQTKTVKIKVQNKLVITMPEDFDSTLVVGENVKIKTNLTSTYKSSDTNVAEVSGTGNVTAKNAGTADITVTPKKYPKLKKTVKITVQEKKQDDSKSEEKTTEKPTDGTTEKPSDPTTEKPTEATTEKPTEPTTEKPTEATTEEKPTTEEPTDPVLVGIEAKYRGDKVPSGYEVDAFGTDIKLLYSDNTKKDLYVTYNTESDIIIEKTSTEIVEGLNYAKYKVTYGEFSTEFTVQVVDVGNTNYPTALLLYVNKDIKIKRGEKPTDSNFTEMKFGMRDSSVQECDDTSKIYYNLYDDNGKKYVFIPIYDYTFEYNGEELYVCLWDKIYVPYEE